MLQVFLGRAALAGSTNNFFFGPCGWQANSPSSNNNVEQVFPAGTVYALYVERIGAPNNTVDFELWINGAEVGSVSITNGSLTGTIQGPFSVADLQSMYLRANANGNTISAGEWRWTIVWECANPGEAFSPGRAQGAPSTSATAFQSVYGANNANGTTEGFVQQIVPMSFTLKRVIGSCHVTPSPGNYVFSIRLDGVTQDGTAGTQDTRMTFSAAGTQSVGSLSIAIAAGQEMCWQTVPASAPVSTARFSVGFVYASTNEGESFIASISSGSLGTSGSAFLAPGFVTQTTTESDGDVTVLGVPFTLRRFYAEIKSTPGAGDTRTYTIRKARANTALTAAISGNGPTEANDLDLSHATVFNPGDQLGMEEVVSGGTPTNARGSWAAVMVVGTPISLILSQAVKRASTY